MGIWVRTLIIETTRRCNMACAHCLRGDAQNIDIKPEYIDLALSEISGISTIIFSGGEPSLNTDALTHTLAACREQGISVESFYIVTNGKEISDNFLDAIRAWDMYCLSNVTGWGPGQKLCMRRIKPHVQRIMEKESCEYLSGLALSLDEYHESIPAENIIKLMHLRAFNTDKFMEEGMEVVRMGRAENLPSQELLREAWAGQVCMDYTKDVEDGCIDMLYLNAKGFFNHDCDMSYDLQDKMAIAHVSEPCWTKALAENSRRMEEAREGR